MGWRPGCGQARRREGIRITTGREDERAPFLLVDVERCVEEGDGDKGGMCVRACITDSVGRGQRKEEKRGVRLQLRLRTCGCGVEQHGQVREGRSAGCLSERVSVEWQWERGRGTFRELK